MACATPLGRERRHRDKAAQQQRSSRAGGWKRRTDSLARRPCRGQPTPPPRRPTAARRAAQSATAATPRPIALSPDPTYGRAWLPCCRSCLRPTDPDGRANRRAIPSTGAHAHACAARSRPSHGVGGRAGGNPTPTLAHLRFDDLHVHVRQCRARVQRPRGRAHARRLLFRGGGRRRSGRFWSRRCGESRRRRGHGASGRRRGEDDEPALQLACEARAERVHLRPAAKGPWPGPGRGEGLNSAWDGDCVGSPERVRRCCAEGAPCRPMPGGHHTFSALAALETRLVLRPTKARRPAARLSGA